MVSGMARLLRFVAVVALVGGATASLTACSGDPGPIVTETPSPTRTVEATPSPSPTPTVTAEEELLAQIPEDARGEDFYSASQFAKFFIAEYDQMFQKRDVELFAFLSGDDCQFCESSLHSYMTLIDAGGRRDGGAVEPTSELPTGGLDDDGYWYVGFPFKLGESTDYDADGTVVETGNGGNGTAAFRLEFLDGRWIVQGVSIDMAA